jgi:hypothetical protein
MKLVIAHSQRWSRFVSREFFTTIVALMTEHGWNHAEPGLFDAGPGRLRDKLIANFGALPEVILFWETYAFVARFYREIERLGCRCACFADDVHHGGEGELLARVPTIVLSDRILCTYADALTRFFPHAARTKQVIWVPHAAAPEFLLEFNERAENAIYLSGNLSHHYPLRLGMNALHRQGAFPIISASSRMLARVRPPDRPARRRRVCAADPPVPRGVHGLQRLSLPRVEIPATGAPTGRPRDGRRAREAKVPRGGTLPRHVG